MTEFTPVPAWDVDPADPLDEVFAHAVSATRVAEADTFDAVLVGEPYDGAVISRPGTAEGPAAIRESLASTKTRHFEAGAVGGVGDLGNLVVDADSVDAAQDTVEAAAETVHDTAAFPVFLGGDNSLTYPNAAPLLERGSLGVLNFDAHLDCREVRDEPTSGSPYRQLFEAGLEGYACVGARHFETTAAYETYVRERGGDIVTAEAVAEDPVEAVDRGLAALSDVDTVYVSVDVDVLDAPYSGASAPTPGGILPRELFRMVRRATADDRVAGFEVVETAPPHDTDGRTVDAAARTVAHALAGRGVR
jgi:formiminoglutamase